MPTISVGKDTHQGRLAIIMLNQFIEYPAWSPILFFTQPLRPSAVSQSFLYALLSNNGAIPVRYRGEGHMSIMQGVALLLAVGLFVYLLAALLRADRG